MTSATAAAAAKDVAENITEHIAEIGPASTGLTVINFILERTGSEHDGLLLADGLVVGDLIIQRSLARDVSKK